ncbi:hypothetical protein FNV43_RR25280 [Rhamnella rubrinervis]|uniref:Uncharacterized protein n=1 Tax=Rhamnella rubrinervis TaxID=2594499 RepID=A0A8K0DN29_9ROSA|nr:hypothetical protein FNV43_RR25280 [Rhamnella rubrinervis]
MGNCLFGGGLGEGDEDGVVIKVVTSNGGIMELLSPITVGCITNEFPGHGIFRSHDLFWKPLCEEEVLVGGESYYLLPLSAGGEEEVEGDHNNQMVIREGHVRSNSVLPTTNHSLVATYRMSLSVDYQRHSSMLKAHPFSTSTSFSSSRAMKNSSSSSSGIWKVKLVISPQQLLEILSQESLTHQLIESGRTVAKCRTSITRNTAASLSLSDHWSLSSSCRNASSDALLHI